jgi:hypothetical protein
MNFDLPIEQIVRRADTRFQLGFANEARERVQPGDGFLLSSSRAGLHVLARNEEELASPLETLRSIYGPALQVGPPTVRLIHGIPVQEPVMHLRIVLETADLPAIKHALKSRRAVIEEEYVRNRRAVLRGEAPLERLIGFPAEVRSLTLDRARCWIVLSHYAPAPLGPQAA